MDIGRGGGRGAKRSSFLKSVTYILQLWNLSYTLCKTNQKYIWITWSAPWVLLTAAFFVLSRNTDTDCIFNFLGVLKIVLINMITIWMMSARLAILGLLKTRICWNNGYDIIISVYDVTKKVFSRSSKYIADLVMWPKFGNSSMSMGEFIINPNL